MKKNEAKEEEEVKALLPKDSQSTAVGDTQT